MIVKAIPTFDEFHLQLAETFGTVFWSVEQTLLPFVKIGRYFDFRVMLLKRRSSQLIVENIERQPVCVAEFLLEGVEKLGQIQFVVDEGNCLWRVWLG